jgi:hypothetical protein
MEVFMKLTDVRPLIKELQEDYHGMLSDESMKIYEIIQMLDNLPIVHAEEVTKCFACKYSRPIDRTKSPEKYFRDDCIVCECEDVVGDEPVVYPNEHYCSFGKVDDGC